VLHEHLRDAWSMRKRTVPISPALHFSPDGLVLGAGKILLPAEGHRRLAKLDGQQARLLALLSATYGRAIAPSVLAFSTSFLINRSGKSTPPVSAGSAGILQNRKRHSLRRRSFTTPTKGEKKSRSWFYRGEGKTDDAGFLPVFHPRRASSSH
jgi:hypothetical protein